MIEGQLLWTPDPKRVAQSQIAQFMDWLARERELRFTDYEALRRWSITDLEGFWSAIWAFYNVQSDRPYDQVTSNTWT